MKSLIIALMIIETLGCSFIFFDTFRIYKKYKKLEIEEILKLIMFTISAILVMSIFIGILKNL